MSLVSDRGRRRPADSLPIALDSGWLPALAVGCLAALVAPRRFRLLAGLMAGGATYLLQQRCGARGQRPTQELAQREAALDESLEESFPSSDPPSFSGATI